MKQLHVHLDYGATGAASRRGRDARLAFPVRALDADGSVLAEGAARVQSPTVLEVPDHVELAFVRLTWPSGRCETRRADLSASSSATVRFSDHEISRNEWSAWAAPKMVSHKTAGIAQEPVRLEMGRFEDVWLRLWKCTPQGWERAALAPQATYRNDAAWQVDVSLQQNAYMLQVGGPDMPWRFVSLPGDGPARVLLTPNTSHDPRADTLRVVVTSFRSDAETLLEFLARDSLHSANVLVGSDAMAKELFAEKIEDPVSAVAGAYYLLRTDRWEGIPRSWFENLPRFFPWLPDAFVIYCIRLLREGVAAEDGGKQARMLLEESLHRGWPVYAEGVSLLQEAESLLGAGGGSERDPSSRRIQALGAAKAWAGAAASFYGRDPGEPDATQWVGMPSAPRRRKAEPKPVAPAALRAGVTSGLLAAAAKVTPDLPPPVDAGEFLLRNIPLS